MQIPSSVTSLFSSWLPNFWDTETKAQNKQVPDLCDLHLNQVLQLYKDEGFCARTGNENSPPRFIRELEKNSWQPQQQASSFLNHIGSMTTEVNRISARVDQLNPEVIQVVLALCTVLSAYAFIAISCASRKPATLKKEHQESIDLLLERVQTLENQVNEIKSLARSTSNSSINVFDEAENIISPQITQNDATLPETEDGQTNLADIDSERTGATVGETLNEGNDELMSRSINLNDLRRAYKSSRIRSTSQGSNSSLASNSSFISNP
ncbi:hypothetical protein [Mycoavidus sp. B2-EB]|uniref:hypothetical protein n=1 Tax=Mycoavidus sp. B2-EB TaxID=2651972 RepID=UPI0016266819|nr:hypothetical protein [Mycoavidus sp. B2-EB]BBO59088.1 hypothetical protein MPB2EB_0189 [Mycoavidus sp. B2-EB]